MSTTAASKRQPMMSESCDNMPKRRKLDFKSFETTAQIVVGADGQRFNFHKELLCNMAPFFKAALQGHFKEATDALITMPEESPEVIRHFQLWAYTGSPLPDGESLQTPQWETLIRLYFFAERHGLLDLQNSIIDMMSAKEIVEVSLPMEFAGLIYEHSSSSCPLRRLMVEWGVQLCDLEEWVEAEYDKAYYPPTFLLDLVMEFYRLRYGGKEPTDWNKLGCKFHVHPVLAQESRQASCGEKDQREPQLEDEQ